MEKFDKENPYKPTAQNPNSIKTIIKVALGVLILIFLVVKCGCGDGKNEIKKYNEIDALVQSHVYIENKLLSPGSAEFESGTQGVTKINDTTFTVNSYVDSQNKFGALLRSEYSLKIIFHPKDDTHEIVDAIIK